MDFNSSEEDTPCESRRPLKKRDVAARSTADQEVISLASSTDDGDEYSDDDETATLKASPMLEKFPNTTQISALSQLTANSPCFATQPASVRQKKTPRNKKLESGRKRKATEDSLLTHSATDAKSATGFLKLSKAPRITGDAVSVAVDASKSMKHLVGTTGRNELNELNKRVLKEAHQAVDTKSKLTSIEKATKVSLGDNRDVAMPDAGTVSRADTTGRQPMKDHGSKVPSSAASENEIDRNGSASAEATTSASRSDRDTKANATETAASTSGTRQHRPPDAIVAHEKPALNVPVAEKKQVQKQEQNGPSSSEGSSNKKAAKSSKPKAPSAKSTNPTKTTGAQTSCAKPTDTPVPSVVATAATQPAVAASKRSNKISIDPTPTGILPSDNRVSLLATSSTKKSDDIVQKRKKMTFQEQVLHHMLCAFKPFTLRTLADDLKTTEAALNYVMLSLLDKGLVWKKDFTSSKGRVKTLYWGNHDGKSKEVNVAITVSLEEREIAKREMLELATREASIKSMLAQVTKEPSNLEINEKLKQEEEKLNDDLQRVETVKMRIRDSERHGTSQGPKMGTGPPKSAALLARERCPNRLKLRINHMRGEWKKRKDMCMDFVDKLADGMEKKPKEIIKLLDIDTDEMNAAVMPPKYNVS